MRRPAFLLVLFLSSWASGYQYGGYSTATHRLQVLDRLIYDQHTCGVARSRLRSRLRSRSLVSPRFSSQPDEANVPSPQIDREEDLQPGPQKGRLLVLLSASFASLVLAGAMGVVKILGFDDGGQGDDNRGLGSPLTTQELRQLQKDESLQRRSLSDMQEERDKDALLEDAREDVALLRVITGQDIRLK